MKLGAVTRDPVCFQITDLLLILQNCYNLALCLQAEKKTAEALTYAQRAYTGRMKVLGKDHPNTLKAQKLVESLTAGSRR